MKLKDIEAANARTMQILRENPNGFNPADYPDMKFYGYYEVDIFECPTFLMFTNDDCPRAADILFHKFFEPESMKIWCRLAATATGILDIGAHVGVYSLAAAALRSDITIHAFEPNPYAFSRLRMHKTINGFNNIFEHRAAVANKDAVSNFGWAKKASLLISSGGATLSSTDNQNLDYTVVKTLKIDGTGLASTLGEHPLIKIDVEGRELSAFKGMLEIIALQPDIVLETFSQEACDGINAIIQPLGYSVYKIYEKTHAVAKRPHLEPCIPDQEGNYNQLLTIRPDNEIAELVA